jgi:hypothetical protein
MAWNEPRLTREGRLHSPQERPGRLGALTPFYYLCDTCLSHAPGTRSNGWQKS